MTKTRKIVDFLRDNGYEAIFDGDITEVEDGSIDFEDNPLINVGVGVNYFTVSKEVFTSKFRFQTVDNKGELLEKLAEFWRA